MQAGPLLRSFVAYLLLPNAVFAIVGHFFFIPRPLVSVDYLLLGAIAGLLSPAIGIAVYALLLAIDAFVSLAPVFHFGLDSAIASVPYGFRLGVGAAALGLGVLTTLSAIAVLGTTVSRPKSVGGKARLSLLGTAVLLFTLDAIGGTNVLWRADRAIFHANVATSALYKVTATLYRRAFQASLGDVGRIVDVPSASEELRRTVGGSDSANSIGAMHTVLVIVESLGHLRDSTGDSLILAPLLSEAIRRRYSVRVGTVPTHGATTSGELRELCGVDADYTRVDRLNIGTCLPARLRSAGFSTIAIHGYTGGFFDRSRWYPQMRFGRVLFAEDLAQGTGIGFCGGTFRGVRDVDAARVVRRELLSAPKGKRHFVYWLTLSSHLPVDASCASGSPLECSRIAAEGQFDDVCVLLRIQRLVAEAVAGIATDPTLSPTRFIVVGDHPPPFFSRKKRSLFVENQVPYVELSPMPVH